MTRRFAFSLKAGRLETLRLATNQRAANGRNGSKADIPLPKNLLSYSMTDELDASSSVTARDRRQSNRNSCGTVHLVNFAQGKDRICSLPCWIRQ